MRQPLDLASAPASRRCMSFCSGIIAQRSEMLIRACGLVLILLLPAVGSDDGANGGSELTSPDIAARLLQHGAPQLLADQVLLAALDGTQLPRFPMLHQAVRELFFQRRTPAQTDASDEHFLGDLESGPNPDVHTHLPPPVPQVASTCQGHVAPAHGRRECPAGSPASSIGGEGQMEGKETEGQRGEQGGCREKETETETRKGEKQTEREREREIQVEREREIRDVIGGWHRDFTGCDEAFHPRELSSIPEVPSLQMAQDTAASLISLPSRRVRAFPGASQEGQNLLQDEAQGSIHRCIGPLKQPCMLWDVCFAAAPRLRLQYFLRKSLNLEEEEETHSTLSSAIKGWSLSHDVTLAKSVGGGAARGGGESGAGVEWIDVEILAPESLLETKFLPETNDVGVLLVRTDVGRVLAYTVFADVLSVFGNLLEFDLLQTQVLLLLPPTSQAFPAHELVWNLISSRPPVPLQDFVRTARVRCVPKLLIGNGYSSCDNPFFWQHRAKQGPYLSAFSAWVRQRETHSSMTGDSAGAGDKWEVGTRDTISTRILVARQDDVAVVVGGEILAEKIRLGYPHVRLDFQSTWRYGSLHMLLQVLEDTSIFITTCGEASLPALFLRKGSHLIFSPPPPSPSSSPRSTPMCFEALAFFELWDHLHVHHVSPPSPPPPPPPPRHTICDGPLEAFSHNPFGLLEKEMMELVRDEGEEDSDRQNVLNYLDLARSFTQRRGSRGLGGGYRGGGGGGDVVRYVECYFWLHRNQALRLDRPEMYTTVVSALQHFEKNTFSREHLLPKQKYTAGVPKPRGDGGGSDTRTVDVWGRGVTGGGDEGWGGGSDGRGSSNGREVGGDDGGGVVSRRTCLRQQSCLMENVCLRGRGGDVWSLVFFSGARGNNLSTGPTVGGGGHWRMPLGGRESESSFLTVDTVEAHANSAVTFEETPTVLIEVTVEDNAGHVIAEDVFCAFHLMWELEMMLLEDTAEKKHPTPSFNSRPFPPPSASHSPRLLDASHQILLHTSCLKGHPKYPKFHTFCERFERQFSAISNRPVRRTWELWGGERMGRVRRVGRGRPASGS
jgi:hypothetical protein